MDKRADRFTVVLEEEYVKLQVEHAKDCLRVLDLRRDLSKLQDDLASANLEICKLEDALERTLEDRAEAWKQRDAAKAQLSACTARHYTQLAKEAAKVKQNICELCMFGEKTPICASPKKRTYVKTTSGDTCTGFVERPQTQGL